MTRLLALVPVMIVAVASWGSSRLAAADEAPVRTVPSVDLSRYLGAWYEVARYDNRFQRRCAGDVVATYSRMPDGRIAVVNRCRQADGSTTVAAGVARVVDARTNARLKVRFAPAALSFIPFVWGDYWVIGLADDYSWSVVGTPGRDYLWVLSRTPVLDAVKYDRAMAAVRENGFDPSRLMPTPNSGAGESGAHGE